MYTNEINPFDRGKNFKLTVHLFYYCIKINRYTLSNKVGLLVIRVFFAIILIICSLSFSFTVTEVILMIMLLSDSLPDQEFNMTEALHFHPFGYELSFFVPQQTAHSAASIDQEGYYSRKEMGFVSHCQSVCSDCYYNYVFTLK